MSPIHIGMSIFVVVMQVLCRQPYCWDFMGVASLACQEDTILQQASNSSGSYHPSCFSTYEGIKAFSGRPYANSFALGVSLQHHGRSHLLR